MSKQHTARYVETRPVSDERVRTEAYRVFYSVNKQLPPGRILRLSLAEWQQLYEPVCDPDRLAGPAECATLRSFLDAMPELIRRGAITVNWSKQPSVQQKYSVDEWGKVTRHHNPAVGTAATPPEKRKAPREAASPIKREPDAPRENWLKEYWQPYWGEMLRGRMSEQDVRNILWREYERARAGKATKAATDDLKVQHIKVNKAEIVGNHTAVRKLATIPEGTIVKLVHPVALPAGDTAFVEPKTKGEVIEAGLKHYVVRFETHRYICPTTLKNKKGGAIECRVEFTAVAPLRTASRDGLPQK
jgi:hypothetical protein